MACEHCKATYRNPATPLRSIAPAIYCVSDAAEKAHATGGMVVSIDPINFPKLCNHGMVLSWKEFWDLRVKKIRDAVNGS